MSSFDPKKILSFFIIGNPRSGTTLLRLMLNMNSSIVVPPECGFSLWLSERFRSVDFSNPKIKVEYVSEVVKTRKFETWNLKEEELRDFILQNSFQKYKDIVLGIYYFYAVSNGRSPFLIGDKNNYYIKYLEEIDSFFENPKYVFIVRDGRDVACSYRELNKKNSANKYYPSLPDEITEIASEWVRNNNIIYNHIYTNPSRSILVKYEDLITSPEMELKRICEFLGSQFENQMLKFYLQNDEPKSFVQWKRNVWKPIDPNNKEKYKLMLKNDEISLFNEIAKDVLSKFDYEC